MQVPSLGQVDNLEEGMTIKVSPLQYSCLENRMNRGTWWAMAHRVAHTWTQLKQLSMHTHVVDLKCWFSFRCTAKWNQLYIYMYPHFFRIFSHIGHYRVLSRFSCSIQQVLIFIYFIYNSVYMSTPISQIIHALDCINIK